MTDKSPTWLDDFIEASDAYCRSRDAEMFGFYPINTERRFQFDGGYRGPRGGTLRMMDGETAEWVDLIHEHVGEEYDD